MSIAQVGNIIYDGGMGQRYILSITDNADESTYFLGDNASWETLRWYGKKGETTLPKMFEERRALLMLCEESKHAEASIDGVGRRSRYSVTIYLTKDEHKMLWDLYKGSAK
jgi:hypothetical protein